jgi:serine/threonine protein kinase
MRSERWEQVKRIYDSALKRDADRRAAYLDQVCAGDEELRREVESLLSYGTRADSFIEAPAMEVAARLITQKPVRLAVGQQIGHYHVIALLGAGGMGEVYLAEDSRLRRSVALKLLPTDFIRDDERVRRFQREARAASALNHPNIITIHEIGRVDDLHYIVTEFIDGQTLRQQLTGTRMNLPEVLEIAVQAASALAAAHEAGIVHRDIKPENIMLRRDGLVKVLDFGLAKLTELTQPLAEAGATTSIGIQTETGVVMGTVGYMSPEQVRGQNVDARTDLFSLGVVLYEMSTGKAPFASESSADVIASILQAEPLPLSQRSPAVPEALDWIVAKLLRKDREERYQTAREVLPDLKSLKRQLEFDAERKRPQNRESEGGAGGIKSGEMSARTPVVEFASRWRSRVWLALGALALVAVGLVLGWAILRSDRLSSAAPSFTRVVRLTRTPYHEFSPAISPDGKWVAYLSDAGGTVNIWVKFVAGGEASNLTAASGLELQGNNAPLEISPDGTMIAARARGGSGSGVDVWLVPAPLPGTPRRFVEAAGGVRWSPDGRRIAYFLAGQSAGDALFVANADGTDRREIVPARGGVHIHEPAWSQDGRYVYFISTTQPFDEAPSSIFRVAFTGGTVEPIIQTSRRAVTPLPTPDGAGLIYAANPTTADLNLWWRPLDGSTAAIRLTTGAGDYTEPRMSADGRRMAATLLDVRQWLVRLPIAGGETSAMVTAGDTGDLEPALASRGPERLVFSSTRSGTRQLWTARPDGTDLRPLTTGTAVDEKPSLSPDGQQIAFISDRGGERGIWLVGTEGGPPQYLVPAPDVMSRPTWSPDGRQIAYDVAGGDRPTLWILSLADKRPQILPTPAGAAMPSWSPSADVIAYLEPQRPGFTRVAFVNSRGQPLYTTLPLSPNISGNASNGGSAWDPDGRRLADLGANSVWIIDPNAAQPYRKLKDFPPTQRPRGLTWTRDGSSLILGIEQATGDIVLFERD